MAHEVKITVTGGDAGAGAVLNSVAAQLGRVQAIGGTLGQGFSGVAGAITAPFTSMFGMMQRLLTLPNLVAAGIGGVLVRSVIDYADAIDEAATKTGATRAALQALALQAAQNNSSFGEVSNALVMLGKTASEAANGNTQLSTMFDRLGVKVTDSEGKVRPIMDLFADVAEGMKNLNSPAERAEIAMGLFSRAGKGLLDVLAGGKSALAEYRRQLDMRGMRIGDEQIQQLAALKDQWAALGLQAKSVFAGALANAAPQLGSAIEEISGRLAELASSGVLTEWIGMVANGLVSIVDAGLRFSSWVADNKDWLIPLGFTLYTVSTLYKIGLAIQGVTAALHAMAVAKAAAAAAGALSAAAGGGGALATAAAAGKGLVTAAGLGATAVAAGTTAAIGGIIGSAIALAVNTARVGFAADDIVVARNQAGMRDKGLLGEMASIFTSSDIETKGFDTADVNRARFERRQRMEADAAQNGAPIQVNGPLTVFANSPEEFAEELPRAVGAPQM